MLEQEALVAASAEQLQIANVAGDDESSTILQSEYLDQIPDDDETRTDLVLEENADEVVGFDKECLPNLIQRLWALISRLCYIRYRAVCYPTWLAS